LTASELETLEAICDRILPPDGDPGARELGAARYIDGFLSAFDPATPQIFAGGPFSGRHPFPDNDTGTASSRFPENSFERFVPLSRLQELRWRAELFGSGFRPGDVGHEPGRPISRLGQPLRDGRRRLPDQLGLQPDADHHRERAQDRSPDRRNTARDPRALIGERRALGGHRFSFQHSESCEFPRNSIASARTTTA
jgi:hypothetical protein